MDEPVTLVDYPAVAPEETHRQIEVFHKACEGVRDATDDNQRRARLKMTTRHADTLLSRRNELETMLQDGDRWLHTNYSEADEEQWLAWDQEYRAIWDALRQGAGIAFGEAPTHEQASLMGVA